MCTTSNRLFRSKKGSFIAEAPFALWILFFLLTVPFLDLATVLLRYTFFVSAARDGVHAAAQSKTFMVNSSTPSAINSAAVAVARTASAFSEIAVTSVQTQIVRTRLSDLQVSRFSAPLSQPADKTFYLYELETTVLGSISPLLNLNIGILPAIPGLTAAVPVQVTAREYCEFPQGLDQ